MEIQYLGHSSFLIKIKNITVVCDPFSSNSSQLGLQFSKGVKADIVTVSHDHHDHNAIFKLEGDPYVIKEPGEFEIGGVNVFGIQSYHDENKGQDRGSNTIYVIEIDGFSICHLGDLGHELSDSQVNELGNVDVLMIPVGGIYTLDGKKAVKVVNQIEPKIVIPMHYKVPELNLELEGVDLFLKEMEQEGIEPEDKLMIKGKEALGEETKVVVLRKS